MFWDHARLESLDLIKEPRSERNFSEDRLPAGFQDWATKKRVEQRLVEMGLVEDRGEGII